MSAPVEIVAYTDGGARGNPGPAGIGVHITSRSGRTLDEIAEGLGIATNNVAEYTAVIRALERALQMGARRVTVRADSLLVVEQMRGVYRVKNPTMQRLWEQARALVKQFERVTFEHVPRGRNKRADALANQAMDDQAVAEPGFAAPDQTDDPTLF